MRKVTRREFVKGSLAAGLALGMSSPLGAAAPGNQVRLAIIGLGGIDIPGSVGGRGRQLMASLGKVPGAKVVALCDVDKTILANGEEICAKAGNKVATYTDFRKVLEDKDIDAVVVATPDHWHVLASVWACQAGKDVYVEKPLSYNIWEGRQVVEAAKKYGRMVQVGTQARSSVGLKEGFEYLRSGQLGKARQAHVIVYRQRDGIGKVTAPTPIPETIDYNLWCGPAPLDPLLRTQLHYDWHWVWSTGTGETGNNGVHSVDMCRWAMGLNEHPRRALSIGQRYKFADDGETPNTNIVMLDYENTPIFCELRALPVKGDEKVAGVPVAIKQGFLIQFEGGFMTGGHTGAQVYDKTGKLIKEFTNPKTPTPEVMHLAGFIDAVRSRDAGKLTAPAIEGHLSAACAHMANVSYKLGKPSKPEAIAEAARANPLLLDAFERCREHLQANDIIMNEKPCVLGSWVTLDPATEKFTGEFAEQANALAVRGEQRKPFEVPQIG